MSDWRDGARGMLTDSWEGWIGAGIEHAIEQIETALRGETDE